MRVYMSKYKNNKGSESRPERSKESEKIRRAPGHDKANQNADLDTRIEKGKAKKP